MCKKCGQEHDQCAAHRSDGNPCGAYPVGGFDKCRIHVGISTAKRKELMLRASQQKAAETAVATFGLPVEIDPHEALLEEVHRTAGHVAWLAKVVSQLEQHELTHGIHSIVRSPDGNETITTKAAMSVWVALYQAERGHLVKVSKAAIDAGIEERRVRIAEDQGALIVDVLKRTLADLNIELTHEVSATVGKHLRSVS